MENIPFEILRRYFTIEKGDIFKFVIAKTWCENYPTNLTKQSLVSKDNSRSSRQDIPCLFMEPEGSLPYSQELATGSYPVTDESSPHPHTQFI